MVPEYGPLPSRKGSEVSALGCSRVSKRYIRVPKQGPILREPRMSIRGSLKGQPVHCDFEAFSGEHLDPIWYLVGIQGLRFRV